MYWPPNMPKRPGCSGLVGSPSATWAEAAAKFRSARTRSGDRMRVSPMRAASTPICRRVNMSAASRTPDSPTNSTSGGTSWRSRAVFVKSTSKVRRSRLLTPRIRAPAARARATSAVSWASTSASMPKFSASAILWARSSSSKRETMRSTAEAPRIAASSICTSSIMNSLRRTGMVRSAAISCRYWGLPWKKSGSVRQLIARAPPCW